MSGRAKSVFANSRGPALHLPLSALCLLSSVLCPLGLLPAEGPEADEAERLVKQLGSDSFQEREA